MFPGTPDGKVHLVSADLDAKRRRGSTPSGRRPGEPFPLALISPSTDKTISSTLGQLRRQHVPVEIHPDDAAARGISDGDRVRLHNSLGEVRCRARVTADVRPGVVSLPKGLWSHNTESGTTANALCPDSLTDLGGGACFNDARIEVERISR